MKGVFNIGSSTRSQGKKARSRNINIRAAFHPRDRIGEAQIAPSCKVCGQMLERKASARGVESMQKWLSRKTCGWIKDKLGHLHKSECLKSYITGKGNPNYKGIMPECKDCGKRTNYTTKKEQKNGIYIIRCRDCWNKHGHETGEFTEQITKKIGDAVFRWKKGHKPWNTGLPALNKLCDFCTVKDCGMKHLAKGLCSKHYQATKKQYALFQEHKKR